MPLIPAFQSQGYIVRPLLKKLKKEKLFFFENHMLRMCHSEEIFFWLCMCRYTCMWRCIRMPEANLSSSSDAILNFTSLGLAASSRLMGWLSEPRDPPVSVSSALGVQVCTTTTCVPHGFWKQTQLLVLTCKHFTNWAISLASKVSFFFKGYFGLFS